MHFPPCALRPLLTAGVLLAGSAAAHAQDLAHTDNNWRFQATPYVWMPSLQGDITIHPVVNKAHVSESFSDIWKDLRAAAFLNATARKQHYVLHADLSHVSLSKNASLPYGLQAKAKVKQTSVSLLGGYNWQLSPNDSLDAMGGARWWNIRTSVNVSPLLDETFKKSFTDPIVALRWRHQFTPRWSSLVYADLGGFDVGSKFTWQALVSLNYQVRDNIYVSAGYRQLNVDVRSANNRIDLKLGGPVLGATFLF